MVVALVLSGGGAKGDFEVGVLKFLYENQVILRDAEWDQFENPQRLGPMSYASSGQSITYRLRFTSCWRP
jgi:hypothetical protein